MWIKNIERNPKPLYINAILNWFLLFIGFVLLHLIKKQIQSFQLARHSNSDELVAI